LVAVITRKSAFNIRVLPRERYSRSCKTRRKRVCKSAGISEISSRKSVPPRASAIIPGKSFIAPVNAPLTYPNNSDSIIVCGKAAQFNFTSGFPARRLLE
jgi:hypothetical protein